MHGLLFFFAGGQAFWWGLLLVGLAAGIALVFPTVSGWRRIAVELLPIAGAGMVWMAGPPLSGWFYFLWIASVVAWLVLFQPWFARRHLFLPIVAQALVLLLAAILIRFEFPYIRTPNIPSPPDRPAAVIGDSLSAGIAAGEVLWPEILAENGWTIENLAIAGAQLDDARTRQASQLNETHSTVILLIGGNDLVRRAPPREFEAHLDALLETVKQPGRTVVLVELPFIPGYREYGRILRAAADRSGALLVPRRHLARVLAGENSTLDGLHLSDDGHREWAETLAKFAE